MLAILQRHLPISRAHLHRLVVPLRSATTTAHSSVNQKDSELPSQQTPKVVSRWLRLRRERRAAPTPANRKKHEFDRTAVHQLSVALEHMRASSWAGFDETVELVFSLNLDPRRAEHNLRGVVTLPHGTGVKQRIVAFVADPASAKHALDAGAELAGSDELIERIAADRGKCVKGFSVALAVPEVTGVIASRVGKILGPKGLMPLAKLGTITTDIPNAIKSFSRGQMNYRIDRFGSLHLVVGKMSFSDEMLTDNLLTAAYTVQQLRPATVKRKYIKKVVLCSSMGPGIQLDSKLLTLQARTALEADEIDATEAENDTSTSTEKSI